MATGFVYHEACLKHDAGEHHPDRPARLLAILQALQSSPMWPRLVQIQAQPADLQWVLSSHSPQYVRRFEQACQDGLSYLDTPDCTISPGSWNAALMAVGGALAAVDHVMENKVRSAFCAVRPPGHHAEYDAAMGFCLLNNVAIATNYLRATYGVNKVLILDWDVHHGNGTQHAFEEDPGVFFCSIHQDPRTFFPGTGYASETGVEAGEGTTLNLPLPAGSRDVDYRRSLEEKFIPAATVFNPEFIFVSAGFDSHADDAISAMSLTDEGFQWMSRMICDLADRCCQGRLVSVLEGGYNLKMLQRCITDHVSILDQ